MAEPSNFGKKIKILMCPSCRKGDLLAVEKSLECAYCKATFQVVGGIPRFVSKSNYADSFGLQWNTHAKTQLDSATGKPISADRLFRVSQWPRDLTGQTILEAGSGAGRFTEVLVQTGASVTSFDLSSAVEANFANNGQHDNLLIVQASILDIPVRPQSIDKVMCLGVIQHTPDPAHTFKCLAECVRPGGELVIDVYAARLRSLLAWKYLLRPFTKRMDSKKLYKLTEVVVDVLFPISNVLFRIFGRFGMRLLPIVQYPQHGFPPNVSRQWSVLDTFDMYSPAHDHPQTIKTVRQWFVAAGFDDVTVEYGPNGVVGRGRKQSSG